MFRSRTRVVWCLPINSRVKLLDCLVGVQHSGIFLYVNPSAEVFSDLQVVKGKLVAYIKAKLFYNLDRHFKRESFNQQVAPLGFLDGVCLNASLRADLELFKVFLDV